MVEARAAGFLGADLLGRRVFVRVAQPLGRGRVYLRRGDRAVGIDRRQKRAAALQAAFSRQLRLVWAADDGQQCRNFRLRAVHRARGRRAFFGYRQAQQRRLESVFPVRPLRTPGQLRSPARHAVSRFVANGGRGQRRARAQGRDSGRVVGADFAGGDDDGFDDGLRFDLQSGLDARRGIGHRVGRRRLHGARAVQFVAFLLRGIVRPMHAVPRGLRLDASGRAPHRGRARARGRFALAVRGRRSNRRPHDLRFRGRGGDAGEKFHQAFRGRIRAPHRRQKCPFPPGYNG